MDATRQTSKIDAARLLDSMRDEAMEAAKLDPKAVLTMVSGVPSDISIVTLDNATGVYIEEQSERGFTVEVLFETDDVNQSASPNMVFDTLDDAMDAARTVLRLAARNSLVNATDRLVPFAFDDIVVKVPQDLVDNAAVIFAGKVSEPVTPALEQLLTQFRAMRLRGDIQGSKARSLDGQGIIDAIQSAAVIALHQGIARWPQLLRN